MKTVRGKYNDAVVWFKNGIDIEVKPDIGSIRGEIAGYF